MKILSVQDKEFSLYGRVIDGYDTNALSEAMEKLPLPEGIQYVPSDATLEQLEIFKQIRDHIFGGMPIQFGWCNGHNAQLNCLEYHRDSEINFSPRDFILLLAKEYEIIDGILDSGCVKAFRCPKNTLINVYANTLHYAPCGASLQEGFKVLVALPFGTNISKPPIEPFNDEDKLLWATNKWLICHRDSVEAKMGAYIGISGDNIDIFKDF